MNDIRDKEMMEAAFRRIRRLRRWLASILLTYLPMFCLSYIMRIPEWILLSACAFWVCAGITIALRIGFSICPVCRQYFHVRGLEGSTFARECVNCGISIDAQG
jgi:hypothetical protein